MARGMSTVVRVSKNGKMLRSGIAFAAVIAVIAIQIAAAAAKGQRPRLAESTEAPQVGRDVVGIAGRESHDGGAERDRRAAQIGTPDPLSPELQPNHERADQQGQEKDAVVPHADAGGQTEEGPVVP